MLPRRATFSLGAPRARWTMYWSVHQYHNPITGAQIAMPSQGKLPLKYHACFTSWPAAFRFDHGGPCALDAGRRQRLPEIEHVGPAQSAGSSLHPPSVIKP